MPRLFGGMRPKRFRRWQSISGSPTGGGYRGSGRQSPYRVDIPMGAQSSRAGGGFVPPTATSSPSAYRGSGVPIGTPSVSIPAPTSGAWGTAPRTRRSKNYRGYGKIGAPARKTKPSIGVPHSAPVIRHSPTPKSVQLSKRLSTARTSIHQRAANIKSSINSRLSNFQSGVGSFIENTQDNISSLRYGGRDPDVVIAAKGRLNSTFHSAGEAAAKRNLDNWFDNRPWIEEGIGKAGDRFYSASDSVSRRVSAAKYAFGDSMYAMGNSGMDALGRMGSAIDSVSSSASRVSQSVVQGGSRIASGASSIGAGMRSGASSIGGSIRRGASQLSSAHVGMQQAVNNAYEQSPLNGLGGRIQSKAAQINSAIDNKAVQVGNRAGQGLAYVNDIDRRVLNYGNRMGHKIGRAQENLSLYMAGSEGFPKFSFPSMRGRAAHGKFGNPFMGESENGYTASTALKVGMGVGALGLVGAGFAMSSGSRRQDDSSRL